MDRARSTSPALGMRNCLRSQAITKDDTLLNTDRRSLGALCAVERLLQCLLFV